jgi:hypothetical protein
MASFRHVLMCLFKPCIAAEEFAHDADGHKSDTLSARTYSSRCHKYWGGLCYKSSCKNAGLPRVARLIILSSKPQRKVGSPYIFRRYHDESCDDRDQVRFPVIISVQHVFFICPKQSDIITSPFCMTTGVPQLAGVPKVAMSPGTVPRRVRPSHSANQRRTLMAISMQDDTRGLCRRDDVIL